MWGDKVTKPCQLIRKPEVASKLGSGINERFSPEYTGHGPRAGVGLLSIKRWTGRPLFPGERLEACTMPKNIAVILGHPDAASLCGALAEQYAASARTAGHTVRLFKLGEMAFDPVLRHGYAKRQALEPALVEVQEAITWAQHLVFVYPIWWGAMPAILKGMFDRIFLPGYAFKYRQGSSWWDRLLAGRSAHAIVTMDTPPWYFRFVYAMPGHHQMKKTILEFCGIKPVRITSFGPVRHASEAQRSKWLRQVARQAAQA